MAGELITGDGQVELQGLLLGRDTVYRLVAFNPFGLPEAEVVEQPRAGDVGVYVGVDYPRAKRVPARIQIRAATPEEKLDALLALTAAFTPPADGSTVPLVFQVAGRRFRRVGKPRLLDPDAPFATAAPYVEAGFVATDPRLYDDTEQTVLLSIPAVAGGVVWPVSWPLAWGAGSSVGAVATNGGSFPTMPTARLDGPLTAPGLFNATLGRTVTWDLTLGASDWLDVDFDARTALLNGAAPRPAKVGSAWWDLQPGDNEIRLIAASGSGSGSGSLSWRSAWI